MWKAMLISVPALLVACSSESLEIHTSAPVGVYELPIRPEASGNKLLGTLPPGAVLKVRSEVLRKDMAAYEIDYEASSGQRLRGYVLLGSVGLDVKQGK